MSGSKIVSRLSKVLYNESPLNCLNPGRLLGRYPPRHRRGGVYDYTDKTSMRFDQSSVVRTNVVISIDRGDGLTLEETLIKPNPSRGKLRFPLH